MNNFKTGDRVCLIIGSEEMVITSVFGNSLVDCEWVGKENRIYRHSFRPESLRLSSIIPEDQSQSGGELSSKIKLGKRLNQ